MSSSPSTCIESVTIVGVGLIGGSLAAAIKQNGIARKVIGLGRNREKLAGAVDRGLLDSATDSLADGAASDLIVFCTPVERIISGVREIANHCGPGTLITDAGSVKGEICRGLAAGLPPDISFIGSHPIAGSEKQGYEFARADLFQHRVCVITPTEQTNPNDLQHLTQFWKNVGSEVTHLTPELHDEILAQTSHLPHLLASALAATLTPENARFVGSGFRDTTRIAAGNSDLWAGILRQNAPALLIAARQFEQVWKQLRKAIEEGDHQTLNRILTEAREKREQLG